jgi:hypothetical protein
MPLCKKNRQDSRERPHSCLEEHYLIGDHALYCSGVEQSWKKFPSNLKVRLSAPRRQVAVRQRKGSWGLGEDTASDKDDSSTTITNQEESESN